MTAVCASAPTPQTASRSTRTAGADRRAHLRLGDRQDQRHRADAAHALAGGSGFSIGRRAVDAVARDDLLPGGTGVGIWGTNIPSPGPFRSSISCGGSASATPAR